MSTILNRVPVDVIYAFFRPNAVNNITGRFSPRIIAATLIVVTSIFFTNKSKAQYIDFGISVGGATYQGDISYLNNRFSFQGARVLKSMHLGIAYNEVISTKIRYTSTFINADDASSFDNWRRERNLHFRSPIHEIAVINEIELFDIIPFFRRYALKPFVSFGVAMFKFNPQAKYRGYWVDLQPLSTEGQGLPDSEKEPYKLTQFSIPFGFGFRYNITDNLSLSYEFTPRMTFTDYLDDVSSTYPDFDLLRSQKGYMAMNLSYRGTRFTDEGDLRDLVGMGRGNSSDNDWYIFNCFTLSYRFDLGTAINNQRNIAGGRKCPGFHKRHNR